MEREVKVKKKKVRSLSFKKKKKRSLKPQNLRAKVAFRHKEGLTRRWIFALSIIAQVQ
jgi:hypothetical protein